MARGRRFAVAMARGSEGFWAGKVLFFSSGGLLSSSGQVPTNDDWSTGPGRELTSRGWSEVRGFSQHWARGFLRAGVGIQRFRVWCLGKSADSKGDLWN